MEEADLERLRRMDWAVIAAQVLNFARRCVGNRGRQGEALPTGTSVEHLTRDAIAEFWQNPERCPQDCSLNVFLCGLVRHKVYNLFKRQEALTTDRDAEIEDFEAPSGAAAPDRVVAIKDEFMTAISLLSEDSAIKGKPDHQLVLTALSCGAFEAPELADATALPITRIYQIQREIRAVYPRIKKVLNTMRGDSHDSR